MRRALTESDVIDALTAEFGARLDYARPAWNRRLGEQLVKARELASETRIVAALVPARTDTVWWWDNARLGEVRALRGRVRFDGHKGGAPFPSAVLLFPFAHRFCFWDVLAGLPPEPAVVLHWERSE